MSTFMGHACLHFPQEMHFSLSQVTLSREKQLRNPSICIFSWERAPRYSSKDGTYLRILLLFLIVFTQYSIRHKRFRVICRRVQNDLFA